MQIIVKKNTVYCHLGWLSYVNAQLELCECDCSIRVFQSVHASIASSSCYMLSKAIPVNTSVLYRCNVCTVHELMQKLTSLRCSAFTGCPVAQYVITSYQHNSWIYHWYSYTMYYALIELTVHQWGMLLRNSWAELHLFYHHWDQMYSSLSPVAKLAIHNTKSWEVLKPP